MDKVVSVCSFLFVVTHYASHITHFIHSHFTITYQIRFYGRSHRTLKDSNWFRFELVPNRFVSFSFIPLVSSVIRRMVSDPFWNENFPVFFTSVQIELVANRRGSNDPIWAKWKKKLQETMKCNCCNRNSTFHRHRALCLTMCIIMCVVSEFCFRGMMDCRRNVCMWDVSAFNTQSNAKLNEWKKQEINAKKKRKKSYEKSAATNRTGMKNMMKNETHILQIYKDRKRGNELKEEKRKKIKIKMKIWW